MAVSSSDINRESSLKSDSVTNFVGISSSEEELYLLDEVGFLMLNFASSYLSHAYTTDFLAKPDDVRIFRVA